jgi:hypothetical protein
VLGVKRAEQGKHPRRHRPACCQGITRHPGASFRSAEV